MYAIRSYYGGIIGRYIYLQIPHTIEGREMSLTELEKTKAEFKQLLQERYQLNPLVITSYSIHYTKLYELVFVPDRQKGTG